MLTINNYKKLEGLILRDGLKVTQISDITDAYSIWLSDNSNIELERTPLNKMNGYILYRMYKGYTNGGAETEFIRAKSIDTLDRMREQLIYMKEKYQ